MIAAGVGAFATLPAVAGRPNSEVRPRIEGREETRAAPQGSN